MIRKSQRREEDMEQQDRTSVKQQKEVQSQELAEQHLTFKPRTVTCDVDKHTFYHVESMRVHCTSCPLVYTMSAGAYLKDGHIYMGDQLLV